MEHPIYSEDFTVPTAYSYLRFSSPKQATGDSIRRQTEARDGWLADHPAYRSTSR